MVRKWSTRCAFVLKFAFLKGSKHPNVKKNEMSTGQPLAASGTNEDKDTISNGIQNSDPKIVFN